MIGAAVRVTPLDLFWRVRRSDFFIVSLTFPLVSCDGRRLIGALSWERLYSTS